MADGPNVIELRVQEITFLTNLFLHPEDMNRYARFLEQNHILTTPIGRDIWKKMYAYYTRYSELPPAELMESIFTEEQLENLSLAAEELSQASSTSHFILDTFTQTMQMNVYKWTMSEMEKALELGSGAFDKMQDIERKMVAQLSVCRQAQGSIDGTLPLTIQDWLKGRLPMQQARVPIPIKGMEFVSGTPVGSVNVLVGGYAVGKTSTLSAMAAILSKAQNVLYVTLETHPNAIMFKVLANQTEGAISANTVFLQPQAANPAELDILQNYMKDKPADGPNLYYLSMSPGEATSAQLEAYTRDLQRKYDVKIPVIMVDYAALMKANSGGGKEEVGWGYTGTILMELAAVAQNMNATIWTAAQAGGQKAHTVTTYSRESFKPLRGADLYGSKEILQNASLVFGIAFMRSAKFPHLAVGVLTTIKNRYGQEYYDYICDMDYSTATLNVLGILQDCSEADTIETVFKRLKSVEDHYEMVQNTSMRKKRAKTKPTDSIMNHIYKATSATSGLSTSPGVQIKAKPTPTQPESGLSVDEAYPM